MRWWLKGIGLALAILSLETVASAQQLRDETGNKLGPLMAPPGGKAYRVTWHGSGTGFVEATVDAAGTTQMRRGYADANLSEVTLQPGDLAAFETELAHSQFNSASTYAQDGTCLDECDYFFLTATTAAGSRTVPVPQERRSSSEFTIGDVADELIQIADARSGDFSGRPAPWWVLNGLEHPFPKVVGQRRGCSVTDASCIREAWRAQLGSLGLSDFWTTPLQYPGETFYRIFWIPPTGATRALLVVREPSHCGITSWPPPEMCKRHVRLSTTSQAKYREIDPLEMDRFEATLYRANFSTISAEPLTQCATGDTWVLEAYIAERYRYVAGSSCDERGLGASISQLRRWAR